MQLRTDAARLPVNYQVGICKRGPVITVVPMQDQHFPEYDAVQVADMLDLPFSDGSFDAVLEKGTFSQV